MFRWAPRPVGVLALKVARRPTRASAGGRRFRPRRATRHRLAPILTIAAVASLLTGCPMHAPPAEVPYPDDPRVLNGAWQVHVTGLDAQATDLVYAPAARRLMAWFDRVPRTFEFDEDVGWREVAVAWAAPVVPGAYDPTLEAFVAIELDRADARIRVTPIDGRPTSVAAVALPAGHTLVSVARGSGRSFALTRDAAGSHHATWWDSVLGTAGGTFTASGAGTNGATWPVSGHAYAHDLHRYLPTASSVTPSALPPPAMYATASVIDPESASERFALSFGTTDRHATSFLGVLHDVVGATSYRVRVERADPPGP